MSTEMNGIYMRSLPKQQLHRRDVPTIFEGNNKSDTTAGSSTTFKNRASELQIYMSLEDHNLPEILENVNLNNRRCQSTTMKERLSSTGNTSST
eukprot:841127-Amphidinium_carterae.1